MGLFDIFKKKQKSEPVKTREENIIADIEIEETSLDFDEITVDIKAVRLEIAELLMYNDEKAIGEANKCIFNLAEYLSEHEDEYNKRSLNKDSGKDTLKWIGIVDCLIRNNYAVELGHNCEKAKFIYKLKKLKGIEKLHLTITPAMENAMLETGDICDWCGYLDSAWSEKGICIGAIDIDSDSYVIFPINVEKLNKISSLANSIKHRITYAQIM